MHHFKKENLAIQTSIHQAESTALLLGREMDRVLDFSKMHFGKIMLLIYPKIAVLSLPGPVKMDEYFGPIMQ